MLQEKETAMPEHARPLAVSGLWTWDHSTNWSGDPTKVESGCFNLYRKEPGSFLEDYTALLEYCGRKEISYLMIAGLFRDSHGGEQGAHDLLAVARQNNVKVLAGIGVNSYGGFYWEGDHPWSLETWLKKHPELRAVVPDPPIRPAPGLHGLGMACPMREETVRWYEDGTRWLLESFDVAGIYLETGDYGLCHCDVCRARSKERKLTTADQSRDQFINEAIAGRVSHDDIALAMPPLVDTAFSVRPDADVVYATYSGFNEATMQNPPPFTDTINPKAICQWTLTDMPYPEPWGDDTLRPPTARNIGYSHLASQWGHINTRHRIALRYIRELCTRAAAAGLEGIFIHGEVSPDDSFTARMNYEALAYFRQKPGTSLHTFAETTLADHFGGADEAVDAVDFMTQTVSEEELLKRTALCRTRAGKMNGAQKGNWEALSAWLRTGVL